MLFPAIDHLPFSLEGADASLTVEQLFPLSGVLGDRRRAAEAELLDPGGGGPGRAGRGARCDRGLPDAARASRDGGGPRRAAVAGRSSFEPRRRGTPRGWGRRRRRCAPRPSSLGSRERCGQARRKSGRGGDAQRRPRWANPGPVPALDAAVPAAEAPTAEGALRRRSRTAELRAGTAEVSRAEADLRRCARCTRRWRWSAPGPRTR